MDELMKQMRHALETAESNGFQRGFAAGLKAVEKAIGAAREDSVRPAKHSHTLRCWSPLDDFSKAKLVCGHD